MDKIEQFLTRHVKTKLFPITVNEICRILNVEPKIENREISLICLNKDKVIKDSAYIAVKSSNYDVNKHIDIAISKGCSVIISEAQIKDYECIIVKSARDAMAKLANFYKSAFDFLPIGITGSYGKTTAKDMTYMVLSEKINTVKTGGSSNSPYAVARTLFNLNEEVQAGVFEMGMNYPGVISKISSMVNPHISVITNIGYSHIEFLKTREGILKAKLEILDGMSGNDYLLINKDDDLLSKLNLTKCKIVTFAIKDKTADFYADNISSNDSCIKFDVINDNQSTEVVLNCIGEHNVYNGLIAFAIGRISGLANSEIVKGLSKYKTDGIRQNVHKYGNKTVIADCYNAAPESMESAIKVLCDYKLEKKGRRVAVLADMLELGEMSPELHKRVGKIVNDSEVDLLFCYGNDSKYIADEIKNTRCHPIFLKSAMALTEVLSLNLRDDDVILFKGSHSMKLEEVIDGVFKSPRPELKPIIHKQVSEISNDINSIAANNYILTNMKTGKIILEKNSEQRVRPASLTKILTAIIAIEKGNYEDIVTVDAKELKHGIIYKKSSMIGIKPGQQIKFLDLLYAFYTVSGNDGANAISKHIFGTIDKAIEFMNIKAKEIGARNSSFMNLHGIDHDNHYTTPKDMLKIIEYAMNNPIFRDIIKQTRYILRPLNDEPLECITTNYMLNSKYEGKYYYPYATGIKTGRTTKAGLCLAASATKNDNELCALVFGSAIINNLMYSFIDTKVLFEYGFNLN